MEIFVTQIICKKIIYIDIIRIAASNTATDDVTRTYLCNIQWLRLHVARGGSAPPPL